MTSSHSDVVGAGESDDDARSDDPPPTRNQAILKTNNISSQLNSGLIIHVCDAQFLRGLRGRLVL